MKRILPLLFLSFALLPALSAYGVEGTWKTCGASNTVRDMDVDATSVWCATSGEVVRWDKRTGSCIRYTIMDGLSAGWANAVFIDRMGRVWASCAPNGICCFEGGAWKRFPVAGGAPDGFGKAIQSRDGRMWFSGFGNGSGVYCFDGAAWKSWKPRNVIKKAPNAIATGSDSIAWFATNEGIWRLQGKTWSSFTIANGIGDNHVYSTAVDHDGVAWFTTDYGLTQCREMKFTVFHTDYKNNPINPLRQVVVDRNNLKWVSTRERGVCRFDGKVWTVYDTSNGLPANRIAHIAVDRNNVKWFCPAPEYAAGVTAFNDTTWTTYTTSNSGLAGNQIRLSLADSLENHWFVTDRGISRFDGASWETFPYGSGGAPDSTVTAVASLGSTVWFGTQNGLVRFDGAEWRTFTVADGLPRNTVTALAPDGAGGLWIGNPNGVCRYNGAGFHAYPERDWLIFDGISDMVEDGNGIMWFAAWGGLARFDGAEWRSYTKEDGPEYDNVRILDRDKNGALLAGTSSHLYRMGPAGLEPCGREMIEPEFQSSWVSTNKGWLAYDHWNGISVYNIASGNTFTLPEPDLGGEQFMNNIFLEDEDTCWIPTGNGLYRFDGGQRALFRTEGLPPYATPILDSVVDHNNVKWFLSWKYLSRFDGKEWTFFPLDSLAAGIERHLAVDTENRIWIFARFYSLSNEPDKFGLLSFDGAKWGKHICDVTRGRLSNGRNLVADHNGVKWIVSPYDLFRYDGRDWKCFSTSFYMTDIAVDRDNTLWVSVLPGLYSFDGASFTQCTDTPPSTSGFEKVFFDSRGGFWLDRYKRTGDGWKQVLFNAAHPPADVDRRGRTWAAASGDVIMYDADGVNIERFSGGDVLMGGQVSTVMVDRDDTVWVGSEHGITWFTPSAPPASVNENRPASLALLGNYPNPFNPSTTIAFSLPESGKATLTVYDVTGRKVRVLVSGKQPAGTHAVVWDGRDERGTTVASGVYLSRLESGKTAVMVKMLLMK